MSLVHFAIATVPIALYLVLIGGFRLRKRPLITTGWRDTLTLGIAASGLMAIGPMQLFFPIQAAARWHSWVWLALFALYVLGLTLVLLSSKPRLIAYGLDESQFRHTLAMAAEKIDPGSAWNGNVLTLPASGIQLAVEPSGAARIHQVVHVGLLNNLQDWLLLEKSFVRAGSQVTCPRSPAGWPLVLSGGLLLVTALAPMLSDPVNSLAQLREFLNR
jgi:hypothetical protein